MTGTDGVHYYEPAKGHGLPHDPFNAIVGPRPIGWVSTRGADGSVNLAPYSFFNAFNYTPPIIGFSSTSVAAPYGTDEFALAGLTAVPSRLVSVPRVAESQVNFECKVSEIVQLRGHAGNAVQAWLVLGEVVAVHIARRLLKDGVFDTFGAGVILRAGGPSAYAEIGPEARFDMARPR